MSSRSIVRPLHAGNVQRSRAPQHGARQGGAGSDRLADSPRQQRQALQLQALFGRAAAPSGTAGVVQGRFTDPEGNSIRTKEGALEVAANIIGRRKIRRSKRETFENALVDLATDGERHGQLTKKALEDLLERGPVRESFGLEHRGRRLHTSTLDERPNFPPGRSEIFKKLGEVKNRPNKRKRKDDSGSDSEGEQKSKGDFTYRDLREVLDLAGVEDMEPGDVEAATRKAVKEFQEKELSFSDDHSIDVQLVVQHLLQYHRFNTPLLKRKGNDEENEHRQHEFEKSKRLLITDSRSGFGLTLPPDPQGPSDSAFAFSGLQDVNRPLPKSTLEGATYKAVYLCVKKVLLEAWRIARQKKRKTTGKDLDMLQRQQFNKALARLLPNLDSSTVGKGQGVQYIRETVGLSKFKEDEGYSEEDSSSSEEDEPLPKKTKRSILDDSKDIESNEGKIKTWTATVGTLSKISVHKQLIDRGTLTGSALKKAERKHVRRRGKIDRHVSRVSDSFLDEFRVTTSELRYLRSKRTMLENRIEQLQTQLRKKELRSLYRQQLERRLKRVRGLLKDLNRFYGRTPVRTLTDRSLKKRTWKRSQPEFRHLGPKTLEKYLTQGEKEK
ncbi:MAG: hypothetical protein V4864_19850 [Pseudomonadota bacterium]